MNEVDCKNVTSMYLKMVDARGRIILQLFNLSVVPL